MVRDATAGLIQNESTQTTSDVIVFYDVQQSRARKVIQDPLILTLEQWDLGAGGGWW